MMRKLYDIFKKYKLVIISLILITVIGMVMLLVIISPSNSQSLKEVNTNNYIVKYDNSWKITEKKDNAITIKHKYSDGVLNFNIIKLDSNYSTIDDLIDEIIYNIEVQNKNHKLISKQEDTFTKYQFSGYKMLYETEKSQTMVAVYKKSDKLVFISYEAGNDCFDMLLDSVHNIIYNFDIKEDSFDLTTKINIGTSEIKYSKEEKIEKLLDKTQDYEIAHNNYYVSYFIPDIFKLRNFDTSNNYFDYKDKDKGSISIDVGIVNKNIYEYLDKDNNFNVYDNYSFYKKDKDYSDFLESISHLQDKKYESYIYKNSYYYDKAITYDKDLNMSEYKKKYENVELIYALNKNHILVIKIASSDLNIPEKLVKMIKINNLKNYSSYVERNIRDGFLIGELKRFTDSNKDKVDNITIKLPDKYTEYEKNTNMYDERYYGLNYDEDKEMYDYEINYRLTSNVTNNLDGQVNIINNSLYDVYGSCNKLVSAGVTTRNKRDFIVYNGGYTNLGGIPFTNINRYKYYIYKKVLFYKINSGGYLIIEINGNGKEISEEIVNEVTNFDIKIENYEGKR